MHAGWRVKVEVNPTWLRSSDYLPSLNEAFGGGWDAHTHAWYLSRPFSGEPADLIVLSDGGPMAGCGLNYRLLGLPSGAGLRVAIITAAWTRPESRGRGVFRHLVRASRHYARRRDVALVIGFVTRSNASFRGMLACGGAEVRAWYLRANPMPVAGPVEPVRIQPVTQDSLAVFRTPANHSRVGFLYPDEKDWAGQFISRPGEVLEARSAAGAALLEDAGDTWRIQSLRARPGHERTLLASLSAWTESADRNLFMYTTRPETAEAALAVGFEAVEGAIAVTIGSRAALARGLELVPTGACHAGELVSPDSNWYLGDWDVESGDRM